MTEQTKPARVRTRKRLGGAPWFPLAFFGSISILFLQFYSPPDALHAGPFGRNGARVGVPDARPAPDAFGRSGGVTMRFALPGDSIEFPLEIYGDPSTLLYQWVPLSGAPVVDALRPLHGAKVQAPAEPGFYQLALRNAAGERVLDDLTLAVKVPFEEKKGSTLNGYRIGTYVSEQKGARSQDRPDGFVQVAASDMDLPLSRHFRVSDFITHDNQEVWPRYSAVSPLILDKVELVMAQIEKLRGSVGARPFTVDVHSAFRTPIYNRQQSQARESRHQYGDAVDFSVDANGDGRINSTDISLITAAVDTVEKYHPELAGGLGIYSGINRRAPYVHIDARGTKVRWRG